ncbi:MAG TPA: 3-phosphoglycerate dehydrogenase [Afipia sp.]|uniref:hydroxyacid dehydrogenase n=1 Tax=unclassified Afipia TaxID=2642050 RepID=UPI000466CCD6|nr:MULTISPECIES: hydroxyacid dehydrogenase [unclassified Afipia]MAH72083.1 3-phosphoglycerate dehydrogenase [Afipia sp.]OUX58700.1 MAG: 3-phosphoglycerate dehydrogenase [Afipia sp. TMED4]HAO41428.1 3-phosphoglycerate dehydrogenase [Afipia sp.]HAP49412.1 3-phosphoglycerate dehydrogenase [Afipia sp.]HBF52585.1 3-phosphoglycerate dehydrogenase [Afipia sp.]
MATNKKKLLIVETMSPGGWALFRERSDIEAIEFPNTISAPDFNEMLRQHAPVNGVALGGTGFGAKEIASSGEMMVVARIGVGYDAVDVKALSGKKIPLMTTGIANSPSVAECALFMMLWLAKRSTELDHIVKSGNWTKRLGAIPYDLLGKTALVVGFGRIGTRTVKRLVAMEMNVLVYDPFKYAAEVEAAGAEYVTDLNTALPRADFVSIHCPKSPETVNMFGAAQLQLMKPTAYLINTARGGIVDEDALHAALTSGKIAGAGIDVFAQEPPRPDHPLFKLDNVITAPHLAGVTREALDRMGLQTAKNILSALDGKPIRENVINQDVLS